MTTTRTPADDIAPVTLADLHEDPARPVPYLVGDKPGGLEDVPATHVTRLVTWAAIGGYGDHTTVTITGRSAPAIHNPVPRGGQRIMEELLLPRADGDFMITGWEIELAEPGREPVMVNLSKQGEVHRRGTRTERDAVWNKTAQAKVAEAREWRRGRGHGPADDISRTTRELWAAEDASAAADAAWRTAIKAGFAAGIPGPEITRLAGGIRAERVYQIRDEQNERQQP